MSAGAIVGVVLGGLVIVYLVTVLCLLPCRVYFMSLFSGCYISAFKLIAMRMRKVNVSEIVTAYVMARKSHLGIILYDLEVLSTSGGHPLKAVEGLNAAKEAKIPIDFQFIKAVDISGRDPLGVVRECINPKIIEIPLITSVAQNKYEVNVKISLTLKVKLRNYLLGVTEDTISARAVEAVVTKIANTQFANDLVARPELLDKAIFDANVDAESKYELVSADVIHIDLGNNRGLVDEKEQIEKNRIIQANQLEHRRLIAVAVEQEMKAKSEEMRAKAIANEAEVPKAVIKAIEDGKIKDVLDYYKLENLQADTEMRRHLIGKKDRKSDVDF